MNIDICYTKLNGVWMLADNEEIIGNRVHVIPCNDLYEHKFADCLCAPGIEQIENRDGDYAYVVTHHSFDGRETCLKL